MRLLPYHNMPKHHALYPQPDRLGILQYILYCPNRNMPIRIPVLHMYLHQYYKVFVMESYYKEPYLHYLTYLGCLIKVAQ